MTSKELREARFDQIRKGGYDPDSVDQMLKRAADQIDAMQSEKQKYEEKLALLAQKVEEYMAEEDKIRTTLLGAQKMSDTIIKEARQKAEIITRDATLKADRTIASAKLKAEREEQSFMRIRSEVARFKSDVLNIYTSHLEILSQIPEPEENDAQGTDNGDEPVCESVEEPMTEKTAEPDFHQQIKAAVMEEITEQFAESHRSVEEEPSFFDDVREDKEPRDIVEPAEEVNEPMPEERPRRNRFSDLDFGDAFSFDNK